MRWATSCPWSMDWWEKNGEENSFNDALGISDLCGFYHKILRIQRAICSAVLSPTWKWSIALHDIVSPILYPKSPPPHISSWLPTLAKWTNHLTLNIFQVITQHGNFDFIHISRWGSNDASLNVREHRPTHTPYSFLSSGNYERCKLGEVESLRTYFLVLKG